MAIEEEREEDNVEVLEIAKRILQEEDAVRLISFVDALCDQNNELYNAARRAVGEEKERLHMILQVKSMEAQIARVKLSTMGVDYNTFKLHQRRGILLLSLFFSPLSC